MLYVIIGAVKTDRGYVMSEYVVMKGVTKSELAQRFGDAGEKAMDKMETLIDSLDEMKPVVVVGVMLTINTCALVFKAASA